MAPFVMISGLSINTLMICGAKIHMRIVNNSPNPVSYTHLNTKIVNQYHITYTLYSDLNHVNYLNIIKRDHVSATVRTRLHLASGWSLDHSEA